jgi:uncharacterized lipoprotein YddW (UPF0748 family)
VKKEKPWVKVGISPFGIWKPGHPPGIAGLDQYAELYADAKLWLNEGWCDYFTPQLYWPIAQEKQSYPKLLAWWAKENTKGRQLWVGNYTSRVTGTAKGWPASEVAEQIKVTRKQDGAGGNVHFSMKSLMNNIGGVADALRGVYKETAVVPAIPWDKSAPPAPPVVKRDGKNVLIQPGDKATVRWFVVRSKEESGWSTRVVPAATETVTIPAVGSDQIHVIAVNRYGQESKATTANNR